MENSPPSIVLWAAWPDVAGLVPQGTWRNFRCRPKKPLHFRCSSLIFCCDRTMYAWIWAVLCQLCLEIWSLTRASLQKLCTNNRGACYLCCIVEYSSFLFSFDSNCALLHRLASKHILTTDIAHKSHVTFLTNQEKVRTSCDFSQALLRRGRPLQVLTVIFDWFIIFLCLS